MYDWSMHRLLGCAILLSALPLVAAAEPLTALLRDPASSYVRPPAKQGYSYPDCYCTDSTGTRVEVGDLACLRIDDRQVTSRCEQASNLTVWRHQYEGCADVPNS